MGFHYQSGVDNMASITINVANSLKQALDEFARKEGIPPDELVEQAIKDHLFLRQFRSLRERMTARARGQGIVSDDDVFNRVS
jgi:predicted transcriptional regulator